MRCSPNCPIIQTVTPRRFNDCQFLSKLLFLSSYELVLATALIMEWHFVLNNKRVDWLTATPKWLLWLLLPSSDVGKKSIQLRIGILFLTVYRIVLTISQYCFCLSWLYMHKNSSIFRSQLVLLLFNQGANLFSALISMTDQNLSSHASHHYAADIW